MNADFTGRPDQTERTDIASQVSCPRCESLEVRRTKRKGILERILLYPLGFRAYRARFAMLASASERNDKTSRGSQLASLCGAPIAFKETHDRLSTAGEPRTIYCSSLQTFHEASIRHSPSQKHTHATQSNHSAIPQICRIRDLESLQDGRPVFEPRFSGWPILSRFCERVGILLL